MIRMIPSVSALSVWLLCLLMGARPLEAQGVPGARAGGGLYWGSLCAASECVSSVNGAGASLEWAKDFGTRLGAGAAVTYWYGSTRELTVQRVTVLATGRVFPSITVPAYVRVGGGLSWDLDDPSTNLAGVLGVGWEVRGLIGATITPFLDAAFFGPPDPLPNLRLVSGGVAFSWPL
jgi:hypothetical protein